MQLINLSLVSQHCFHNDHFTPQYPKLTCRSCQPFYIFTLAHLLPLSLVHLQQQNKVNRRDLIAATGLVILLKFDSNRRFFSPCDLEIWWMTSKDYRAPLLHYIKHCAYQTPRWIQTGVTVRKRSIRVKIGIFCPVWPWNLMDDFEKQ